MVPTLLHTANARARSLPASTRSTSDSPHAGLHPRETSTRHTANEFASPSLEAINQQRANNNGDTSRRAQSFDPHALLNPKALGKRRNNNALEDSERDTNNAAVNVGSMIERMHNLERREDIAPARKKAKNSEDADRNAKSSFTGPMSRGTELGQYIKDLRKDPATGVTLPTHEVVDLTEGEALQAKVEHRQSC
jgi:hypothetical protein